MLIMSITSIVNMRIISVWEHNINQTVCQICKLDLHSKCIICIDSNHAGSCNISIGVCDHAFHCHCINDYIKKSVKSCPVDCVPWEVKYNNYDSREKFHMYLDQEKLPTLYSLAKIAN